MINRAIGALERCCALDQFGPMVTLTPDICNGIGLLPVTDAFDVDERCHVASALDSATLGSR